MKTLTPEQRMEGFTELEGVLGPDAHLMSFLAGVAHAEKVFASQEQDEGPVAWTNKQEINALTEECTVYMYAEPMEGEDNIPLYLHPAPRKQDDEPVAIRDAYTAGLFDGKALTPRKPFVRLSEEECISIHRKWVDSGRSISRFARAIEDALEEKNK